MTQRDSIRTSKGLHKLQLLREFKGSPDQFWTIFLDSVADLVGADDGIIVERTTGSDSKRLVATNTKNQNGEMLKVLENVAAETLPKCSDDKVTVITTAQFSILVVPFQNESGIPLTYGFLKIAVIDSTEISIASVALKSVADIPMFYQRQSEALRVLQQREQILNVLDLNVLLNSQTHFLAAAMVLCNELASAYKCTRVSLGWIKGSYIRLKAMSQTDQFEKKMDIVQKIEAAMEECAQQNTEIIFPVNGNEESLYVRDHESYLNAASVETLLSMPVRINNTVAGVCLLEKNSGSFTDAEIDHVRMLIDQVSARLNDLFLRDRWAGARLAEWSRNKLSVLLGYEHTWAKLITGIIVIFLLFMLIVPVGYRIDSPMILKTDDVTFLAAPFEGYIASVAAEAGEQVDQGKVILSLDNKELILEAAGLKAEYTKSKREEDRFRAEQRLAEMRIAQSKSEQMLSRLDIVNLRLEQAEIKAPFASIIIEGDQQERIGSPVRQGEVLFKLGRIEDIRVEAKVSENDIQNVHAGATGQIALASRPNEYFAISVLRIEPAAVAEAAGNIFQVVCTFENEVPQWFRPGMTGISKINAGKKTLFWIITHRTFDFLWLKLWW
jgi:Barrel-sandwich domain of CusB or HlyD membrane-fusion/GAF domain